MKKLSIILIGALVALVSCTKSKEVHPELGDGNEEFLTVGATTAHVEYTRTDIAELRKVLFHYSLSGTQPFAATEMTKKEDFFDLTLNDLVNDTLYQYYYELFPSNGEASLTEQKTFHTLAVDSPEPPTPPSGVPEGAINGLFTINENGNQVYFSQGNLQYQASTNTWRFAENQWNVVGGKEYYSGETGGNVMGSSNNEVSSDYSGWIDLFMFGTSGYDHGAVCYQPWSVSLHYDYYYAYGLDYANLNDFTKQADWGYNAISNGGNQEGLWRTLTMEEWKYLIDIRNTSSSTRYAKAQVNQVNGILLFPDNWIETILLNNANESEACFDSNVLTLSQWEELENDGVVFLPIAGYRVETSVHYLWSEANYQSATTYNNQYTFYLMFSNNGIRVSYGSRYVGQSVRLVYNKQ